MRHVLLYIFLWLFFVVNSCEFFALLTDYWPAFSNYNYYVVVTALFHNNFDKTFL